jgi:hypothetical protein
MLGRYGENWKSKPFKLCRAPIIIGSITLVRGDYAIDSRLANSLNNFKIERRSPFSCVDHDYANCGIFDSQFCLRTSFRIERIVCYSLIKSNSAGINEHHPAPSEIDLARYAVARYTRLIEHNRNTLFCKPVEKCAFARIRTPD